MQSIGDAIPGLKREHGVLVIVMLLVYGSISIQLSYHYSDIIFSRALQERVKNISIGYIHTGKTGGSTISMLLRNGCHQYLPKPCRDVPNETRLSEIVAHYYHIPDFSRLPTSRDDEYILSVRDPYERTISAFVYQHPENANTFGLKIDEDNPGWTYAFECFPTLDVFANLVMGTRKTDCEYPNNHRVIDPSNCTRLACAAIHGKVRFYTHFFFNYRNLLHTKIPISRGLYVIRQEALWNDWSELNRIFGHQGDIVIPNDERSKMRNNTGLRYPVSKHISHEGRRKLCNALELEYVAYFQLLVRAKNLRVQDHEDTRAIALRNCPHLELLSMLSFD